MGTIFPSETVAEAISLVDEHFYLSRIGSDKYVIHPKTQTGYENFKKTIRTLEKLGYKRVPSTDKSAAILKLPSRKLTLRGEKFAGEKLALELEAKTFEVKPASNVSQSWNYVIVLPRVTEKTSQERIFQLIEGMKSQLRKNGYKLHHNGSNTILVRSKHPVDEYSHLVNILKKAVA